MGSFISWFERSYKVVIVVLVAIMAFALVVLAVQHVNASKPAAGAEAAPIPTFTFKPEGRTRAVFFGDSYVQGFGASSPDKRWSTLVAEKEGWTEINLGQGGTGYVNGGPDKGQADQYATRIGRIKAANPDVVVVFGSQNDLAFPSSEVVPAIKTTVRQIHDAVPDARLVVVGPMNPHSMQQATRDNDAAARSAAAEVNADYISMIDPGSPLTDDSDYYSDGKHPSDSGYAKIAARVESKLPADIPTGTPSPTAG